MDFFVPQATSKEQTESVYSSIEKHVNGIPSKKRIWQLKWEHQGEKMFAEVGKPLPSYFQTEQEPVLAIISCLTSYAICTPNSGGFRGGPIIASKSPDTIPVYFDNNEN